MFLIWKKLIVLVGFELMMVVALELLCLSWPCTFSSKFQFCTSTTILKIGIHFFPNRCPTIWYLSYYFHLYFRTEICKPCKSIQSSFLLARALARVRTPSCARARSSARRSDRKSWNRKRVDPDRICYIHIWVITQEMVLIVGSHSSSNNNRKVLG